MPTPETLADELTCGECGRRKLYVMYSPWRFTGSWAWLLTRWSPYGDGAYYPGLAAKIHGGWVTAFVSATPLVASRRDRRYRRRVANRAAARKRRK
jgi:hypothetical protein